MKGNTQIVTKRGVEAVAIISVDAFNKLKRGRNSQSLISTIISPKHKLDLSRSQKTMNKVV